MRICAAAVLCVIVMFDWLVLLSDADMTFANPAVAIVALVMSGFVSIAAITALAAVGNVTQQVGSGSKPSQVNAPGTTVTASAATGVSSEINEARSQTI